MKVDEGVVHGLHAGESECTYKGGGAGVVVGDERARVNERIRPRARARCWRAQEGVNKDERADFGQDKSMGKGADKSEGEGTSGRNCEREYGWVVTTIATYWNNGMESICGQ